MISLFLFLMLVLIDYISWWKYGEDITLYNVLYNCAGPLLILIPYGVLGVLLIFFCRNMTFLNKVIFPGFKENKQ